MVPVQEITVTTHLVVADSGRLAVAVCSPSVIGVCFNSIESQVLEPEAVQKLLHTGTWATILRNQDNAYFVPPVGLLPSLDGSSVVPPDMEAVHMAIEIGLATWPEWGRVLRAHYAPRVTTPIGFPANEIEA